VSVGLLCAYSAVCCSKRQTPYINICISALTQPHLNSGLPQITTGIDFRRQRVKCTWKIAHFNWLSVVLLMLLRDGWETRDLLCCGHTRYRLHVSRFWPLFWSVRVTEILSGTRTCGFYVLMGVTVFKCWHVRAPWKSISRTPCWESRRWGVRFTWVGRVVETVCLQ